MGMNNRTRIIAILSALMLVAAIGTGCSPTIVTPAATTPAGTTAAGTTTAGTGSALSGQIVSAGSTSMEKVMKALGETFTAANPKVTVDVQGGGSSAGVKGAADGTADIGNSSRRMKTEEKTANPTLVETVIAIDGIAVIVHPSNPAKTLTAAQIADIFTGRITNWKEVGGADKDITVIIRESGSGTRDGFESILGIADKCVPDQEVNETGIVKSTVAGNSQAIGYMSLGELDSSVTPVKVDGVDATEANVKNGTYKIQRDFVCITDGRPEGLTKAFLDFVLGADGQAVVAKKGLVKVG